jgi:hypothetical protein
MVGSLDPIPLPDGSTFTPSVKWVEVSVNRFDVEAERERSLREVRDQLRRNGVTTDTGIGRSLLDDINRDFDKTLELAGSGNCGFFVIQRGPASAFGRASHTSICAESDPANTHFWGASGQVTQGMQAAGWGNDQCISYVVAKQYLWIDDSSAYGFYQNYTGWASGFCAGTRNHVRMWDIYDGSWGLGYSVGTAHRETWSWGDLKHHVVPNGWHLGRDAVWLDHHAAAGYYNWNSSGYWGSGGYFGGWAAEMVVIAFTDAERWH